CVSSQNAPAPANISTTNPTSHVRRRMILDSIIGAPFRCGVRPHVQTMRAREYSRAPRFILIRGSLFGWLAIFLVAATAVAYDGLVLCLEAGLILGVGSGGLGVGDRLVELGHEIGLLLPDRR